MRGIFSGCIMCQQVNFCDLGVTEYHQAWSIQQQIQAGLIDEKLAVRDETFTGDKSRDVLLFTEHPHVYTLGKSGDIEHLLRSEEELNSLKAEFVKTDRGGDITYHGPGQLVGYPILDLERYFTDIHKYLRLLEEVIIQSCAYYGVTAHRIEGLTGVWVDNAKICAMGVRCSRWVTMHGFALNVNTDLKYFNHIVPCGIEGKTVTSLQALTGKILSLQDVKNELLRQFEYHFNVDIIRKNTIAKEMDISTQVL